MGWKDDLAQVCVNAGVGTLGTNIFLGLKSALPLGDGPYLTIVPTGGSGPDPTHNDGTIAYVRPAAQFLATAKTYEDAEAMIYAAFSAVTVIENQFIPPSGTTWYVKINPLQNPFDMPPDELARARIAFNVLGKKRFS